MKSKPPLAPMPMTHAAAAVVIVKTYLHHDWTLLHFLFLYPRISASQAGMGPMIANTIAVPLIKHCVTSSLDTIEKAVPLLPARATLPVMPWQHKHRPIKMH